MPDPSPDDRLRAFLADVEATTRRILAARAHPGYRCSNGFRGRIAHELDLRAAALKRGDLPRARTSLASIAAIAAVEALGAKEVASHG